MTQHDIICEMYRLSVQRQEIEEKICDLAKTLHERASFMRRANDRRAQEEALTEPDDDIDDIDDDDDDDDDIDDVEKEIFAFIRKAKERNHKGLHTCSIKNFDASHMDAFNAMLDAGKIEKVKIRTNCYFVECEQ